MNLDAETIEREALADLHTAAPPELVARLKLQWRPVGTATISVAGALPASAVVINRVIGLGLDAPETKQTVDEIVGAYRDGGMTRFFVHLHPHAQPPELAKWLVAAGLEKARGWQKFHRVPGLIPDAGTDLRIEQIGPQHGEAFARIVCDGFDLGEAAVPWLAQLPDRPDWRVFMSFDGDQPAGCGTLFVRDGSGWLDWAATAPKHRGRGSQSALLARRIRHAFDEGCRTLFTCTGEDIAGDPQHSYRNIIKMGFEKDYLRANYAPPKR